VDKWLGRTVEDWTISTVIYLFFFISLMTYVTSLDYLLNVDESLVTYRVVDNTDIIRAVRLWQRAREDRPLDRGRVFCDQTRTRTDVVPDIGVLLFCKYMYSILRPSL